LKHKGAEEPLLQHPILHLPGASALGERWSRPVAGRTSEPGSLACPRGFMSAAHGVHRRGFDAEQACVDAVVDVEVADVEVRQGKPPFS
jgi:hypothetical protein